MYDHPPVTPMAHMTAWWSKYRYVSGLVTESIAPNRQNVGAMCASVLAPYRLKAGFKTIAPLTFTVFYYKTFIAQMQELNDLEKRRHWD